MAYNLEITPPASPTDSWFKAIQNTYSLARSCVLRFSIATTKCWAVVLGLQEDGSYYMVGIDENSVAYVWRYDGSTLNKVYSASIWSDFSSVNNYITIAFREIQFGDTKTVYHHAISMWNNRQLIITWVSPVDTPLAGRVRWGFAVHNSTSGPGAQTFSNIEVPELSSFLDWISLDPGEAPNSALQRVTEGEVIDYRVRFNEKLKAHKPKARASSRTYTADDILSKQMASDIRGVKTHIRQHGAYVYAEYVDQELLQKYGHRYVELNNPYLMTEQECYEYAQLALKLMQEQALTGSYVMHYNPLLEPGDRITTPDGDCVIDAIQVDFKPGDVIQNLRVKDYVYG